MYCLGNESRSCLGVVLPVWSKNTACLVVASKAVDARLDKNKTVLAIDIMLSVLKVLANVCSLLDEVVEFLWESWCKTISLKDAENFNACDSTDHTNAVTITEESANLGWANTLLSIIADHLNAVLGRKLKPVWG